MAAASPSVKSRRWLSGSTRLLDAACTPSKGLADTPLPDSFSHWKTLRTGVRYLVLIVTGSRSVVSPVALACAIRSGTLMAL